MVTATLLLLPLLTPLHPSLAWHQLNHRVQKLTGFPKTAHFTDPRAKLILASLPLTGADSRLPNWYTSQVLSNSELSLLPPSPLAPLEIYTEIQWILAVNIIGARSTVNSFCLQDPTSIWRALENSIESMSVLEKNRPVTVWLDKQSYLNLFSPT